MVRSARFAVFFFILACGDAITDPKLCDLSLNHVGVFVIDANGTPLENLSFRTVLTRTNEIVGLDLRDVAHAGSYPVIGDLDREVLRPGGDALAFAAWDSTRVATARFVAGYDGCHVFKKGGRTPLSPSEGHHRA